MCDDTNIELINLITHTHTQLKHFIQHDCFIDDN